MRLSNGFSDKRKLDFLGGILFSVLTLVFLAVFFTNTAFFNWAFERHHSLWSWYIRPLFILPIVFFAYKKSWTGVMASIFGLFTSMFWFSAPMASSAEVEKFLAYEMDYLMSAWTGEKILFSLTVPAFFIGLITATWQRNWKVMVAVIVLAAILKMVWSIVFAGPEGMSIIKPAVSGLVICVTGIYLFKRYKRKQK